MAEPAAKMDDEISSDGTSQVWVQPPPPPPKPPPKTVFFSYKGSIDNNYSSNVFIMGKSAATVGSTATNSNPPAMQTEVTSQGALLTIDVNNTATITNGSSTVYINGKKAARNGDKANTWDYSKPSPEPPPEQPPGPPGVPQEKENGKVKAIGSVYIGG